MTTPGEMVKCAAAALGVPEMTLTQIDRELVTNGLRTKGGRGRSAAKMTAHDVANLLIASSTGALVKDSIETVQAYAKLPVNPSKGWELSKLPLPAVQALTENHTFGDAVHAFIQSFERGEFDAAVCALPKKQVGKHTIPNLIHLEFRLFGPLPQASIRIFGGGQFDEEHRYDLNPREGDDIMAWAEKVEGKYGDQMRMYQFTHRTISRMADFLRGGLSS